MRKIVPYLAALAVLAAACGGGSKTKPKATATPATCTPSGTALTITAQNLKFDKKCLAAPAGQAFTIDLENKDADQHNLAIYKSSDTKENLFRGEIKGGPVTSHYSVPALAAGRYFFHCDVHTDMTGTFIAE